MYSSLELGWRDASKCHISPPTWVIQNQPLDSHLGRGGSQVKNAVKLLGRRNEREAALQPPRSEQKEGRRCSRHRAEIPMMQQGRE